MKYVKCKYLIYIIVFIVLAVITFNYIVLENAEVYDYHEWFKWHKILLVTNGACEISCLFLSILLINKNLRFD